MLYRHVTMYKNVGIKLNYDDKYFFFQRQVIILLKTDIMSSRMQRGVVRCMVPDVSNLETSVNTQLKTQLHITEDLDPQQHGGHLISRKMVH
jgi:hypothetical protein